MPPSTMALTLTLPGPSAGVSGSLDSYCSLKPLCSGMGEVVPARTLPTLLPHPLALCCHYPVSMCCSASIVVTSTVRVNAVDCVAEHLSLPNYTLCKKAAIHQIWHVPVMFTLQEAVASANIHQRKCHIWNIVVTLSCVTTWHALC